MNPNGKRKRFRSIFSPCTDRERRDNFEHYWQYTQGHDGEIMEDQKDLLKKRIKLEEFQRLAVRSRRPLPDPELFYRNYERLHDNPRRLDKKTLLLTCIYKFARHEWVGVSAAWDAIPPMHRVKKTTENISRYHLCEEFCHVRLFHEMFRTFYLEKVQWIPLGKWSQRLYKIFPHIPESIMSPPAFVTELMGLTFYVHLDKALDEILKDEPEARDRLRQLLHEIMADELAHIGQRRNFIPRWGLGIARRLVRPMMWFFWRDIPEAKFLFNIPQMIRDALSFDYNDIPDEIVERSWIPSYCFAT